MLGVGVALILGVALGPAAIAGAAMHATMYVATWPLAKLGRGQPTGSTNLLVDDDIASIVDPRRVRRIERRWPELPMVQPELRATPLLAPRAP